MENNQLKAQEIIKSIRQNQTSNSNRLQNLDTQVKDLSDTLRAVQEQASKPIVIDGKEAGLKQYINQDGSLQLVTEKKSVNLPGYGHVNVTQKGLLDSDSTHTEWHAELKDMCRTRSFAKMLVKETPKADAKLMRHLQKAPSFMRDLVQKSLSDTASSGGEWVPDEFRDAMYSEYMTPRTLADEFQTIEVERPTVLIPRMTYGGRPFLRGKVTSDAIDGNAFPASTPESSQASITIKGLTTRYRVDTDLLEDAAMQLVPILSTQIGQDLSDAYEDAIINGDVRNFAASQDPRRDVWNIRSRWGGGTFADGSDHRQLFDGLRLQARGKVNCTVDLNAAALTSAKILELISKTGEMAAAEGLMIITSPEYFIKEFMPLTEVLTVDKFGSAATIITGQLGSIFGTPIVLSRFMDINLNADGCFDNSGSKSGVLVVNKASYYNYQKSGIRIETAKEIGSGAIEIVSSLRRSFASPETAAAKNVAFLHDTADI